LTRHYLQLTALGLTLVAPASAAQDRDSDVYILAGQSNMSGRGAVGELNAAERAIDPAIRFYRNDGHWRAAVEPLDDARDQVDAVSVDNQAAVGPGLFFARAVRVSTRRDVWLVPCAKGGSSIARWAPGGGRDTLYGSCLARVREAGGRVAGVLWYQGESDAGRDTAAAARWTPAFRAFVAALRRDLGSPRLPVALVQLSDAPARPQDEGRYPGWTSIQQQQLDTGLDCARTVTAVGLPHLPDDLHLTTSAQRILGSRLATAMLSLHRRGCR